MDSVAATIAAAAIAAVSALAVAIIQRSKTTAEQNGIRAKAELDRQESLARAMETVENAGERLRQTQEELDRVRAALAAARARLARCTCGMGDEMIEVALLQRPPGG